jgi:transcription elongation factor Elf1
MNKYFVRRSRCPACQSSEYNELVRAVLTQPPCGDYLLSFYGAQGGVELEYLDEQDYALAECLDCGLVYQQEIPGEFLMHKLYEEWIDLFNDN